MVSVTATGFPLTEAIVGAGRFSSMEEIGPSDSPAAGLFTANEVRLYCNSLCKDSAAYPIRVGYPMTAFVC